jgi:hypothetical protein
VRLGGFDALVMPSVAILPPRIADLATDEDAYTQANMMALRNASLINMIDGCALSLPIAGGRRRAGRPDGGRRRGRGPEGSRGFCCGRGAAGSETLRPAGGETSPSASRLSRGALHGR